MSAVVIQGKEFQLLPELSVRRMDQLLELEEETGLKLVGGTLRDTLKLTRKDGQLKRYLTLLLDGPFDEIDEGTIPFSELQEALGAFFEPSAAQKSA